MNFTKRAVLASSLSMLLCTSLLANEVYNIKSGSLQESINKISQISNMKYRGDTKILEGKIAPSITNIEGVKNALKEVLKGTNLEAIIKDNTIIIQAIESAQLDDVEVIADNNNITEDTGSYTTASMNTATKLNLSIRDTPQSVTVMTSQELEDKDINYLQELLEHVTGVSVNRKDERIYSTARGFDIDNYKLDGITRASKIESRQDDLSIFDRVEILRGATALTTGAGEPSISINLVRKKANSKEFKGSTSFSVNSFGATSIAADVSSKLNEEGNIRGRVVVKHKEGGTHLDDYDTENNLIYGTVTADLTDTTTISLGASWEKTYADNVRSGGLSAWDSNGDLINWDVTDHFSEDWTFTENVAKEFFVEIDQVLYNDIKLNVDYLRSEISRKTALINFAGYLDVDTGGGTKYYTWKSEHLDVSNGLEANIDIPFTVAGLEQQIIIGTSYSKEEAKNYDAANTVTSLSNFYGYDIDYPIYDIVEKEAPEYTLQKAAYISGKFNLNEQLKLISGVRISSWEYKSTDNEKEDKNFTGEVTPYLGFVYDLDANHSIYTSYTSIFNPQDDKDINGDYLDPVTGESYEAGIKGEYFDGKLNASLSIFRTEQKGVATVTEDKRVDNPLLSAYEASEGITSKGFEIDVNGEITDTLNLAFGLSNFEAKDADGEKASTTSARTTANIFATYLLNKDLTLGGGLRYKSKFYVDGSYGTITQDAFFLANIMGNYKINKDTSFQLNVENLFDKRYYIGMSSDEYTYGSPRAITMNLKYTF